MTAWRKRWSPGTRWLLLVLALGAVRFPEVRAAQAQGTGADSPIGRIRLLPAGERAAVAIELSDTLTQVSAKETTDNRLVVVEVGPISTPVIPLTLEAAPTSQIVRAVRIRDGETPNGRTVRIEVTADQPVAGSIRMSGSLLYIDLVPGAPRP